MNLVLTEYQHFSRKRYFVTNENYIFVISSPICLNLNSAPCGGTKALEDAMSNSIASLKHHLPVSASPPACAPLLPTVPDSHIESIQSLRIKAAEQINQIRENCPPSS